MTCTFSGNYKYHLLCYFLHYEESYHIIRYAQREVVVTVYVSTYIFNGIILYESRQKPYFRYKYEICRLMCLSYGKLWLVISIHKLNYTYNIYILWNTSMSKIWNPCYKIYEDLYFVLKVHILPQHERSWMADVLYLS